MSRAEPYSLKKHLTMTYDKNVGAGDRIFRIVSGLAIAALGPLLGWPMWATVATAAFGLVWLATGVVSKCGVYYIIGHSTCKANTESAPGLIQSPQPQACPAGHAFVRPL